MLPTFVIGLREGVEAALIVGILAAFVKKEGGDAKTMRYLWLGVAAAAALCMAVGVTLDLVNQELPQKQQEMLETVIGTLAVGVVTWMIFWMRRNARGLKNELQRSAGQAMATGSMYALVGMAFFAVLREGLETAVFLLAVFQDASDPALAGTGAGLGLLVAFLIGYGIYRGGVKIDLQRFFKFTSIVLVVVAAGLLAQAAGTAWEAGWVTFLQSHPLDLTWLVVPGTWTSSLLTGMLGLAPRPATMQIIVYLVYLVPMLTFVLWPQGGPTRRSAREPSRSGAQTA